MTSNLLDKGSQDEIRRVSGELRHKHIRTLEVLRRLLDENICLRRKLKLGSINHWMDTADDTEEGGTDEKAGALEEEVDRLRKKLETATETSIQRGQEIDRLSAELRQAREEAELARATEDRLATNIAIMEASKQEIENENKLSQFRQLSHVQHLESEVAKLRDRLATSMNDTTTESDRVNVEQESFHRESDSEGVKKCSVVQDPCHNWETEELRSRLKKATRRARAARKRCGMLEKRVKEEAQNRASLLREVELARRVAVAKVAKGVKGIITGGNKKTFHAIEKTKFR